jgi:hypothetical protein
VKGIAAALGRSLYRPAHIHYEVHHPDLITPWFGEIYFKGDLVIPVDYVGAKIAHPALQADTSLHEDPEDIAGHGFRGPYRTMDFDFLLKTRTSPDTSTRRRRRHDPRGRHRLVAGPAEHALLPPLRPPRVRRGTRPVHPPTPGTRSTDRNCAATPRSSTCSTPAPAPN